jgi:hypothetical protein
MRTALLVALLLAGTIAGCLTPGERDDGDDNGAVPGDGNGDGASVARAWPAIGEAVIRPGVPVSSDTGSCTSNFVYRSPDNETLYLGLAAHCLEGRENETVRIAGGAAEGIIAYNSWYTMDSGS